MTEKHIKILKEAQDRLKAAIDDEGENRKAALEDLEFIAIEGSQWPENIKNERTANGQPCLTINKLPTFISQVVGDQRMNRPSINVIAVDSVADPKVANLLGGWIKHVQAISNADVAIDHGFEHAVSCGYGAMRVITDYSTDTGFEQEAYIEKVANALSVYWGPHEKYDCSDAKYCFIISDMIRSEYDKLYKDNPVPFQSSDSRFVDGWSTKDTVRVAEYFVKEPITKTIYLLEDGSVVDELKKGTKEVSKRNVNTYQIKWYLLSGSAVLNEKVWLGKKYIPIIPIWGKELNVGGKRVISSLIRNAKDSQRMFNYWNSVDTEVVALQPRVPYMATAKQIDGHEAMWKQANKENFPYLLVNPDKDAPGWPQRQAPPQASSAMTERIQATDQEMRDTIGLQKASLGMQSNERSGTAIRERKLEGDVGTFSFTDNLSRSIEQLGRVLLDIAPALLDTDRIVRLGLNDGSFAFDAVNVKDGDKVLNDLSIGTYDVTVTVGPSFTSQRSEARQSMAEFIQYYPQAAPLIGDLYSKAMDWPGAQEVSERLEYLLPPEVKAQVLAKRAKQTGEQVPPAPQQQPDSEQVLNIQQEQIKLEEAKVKLQIENEKLKGVILQNELLISTNKESVRKHIQDILKEGADANKAVEESNTPDTFLSPTLLGDASPSGEVDANTDINLMEEK
jgi:hypothetical protein